MQFRNLILPVALLLTGTTITAQEKEEEFKPSGKSIGQAFFDYSIGFGDHSKEVGLDVTRALLGYNYKFTKNLQAQVVVDGAAGKNDKGNLEPAIRNVFIRYEEGNFSIDAGLIGLNQFTVQGDFWKHRYVEKTFQDLNKMGNATDAGIFINYKISPMFSVDATYSNGEGYRKLKKNESNRYALGLTINPVRNITFRAYADVYNESKEMSEALPVGVTGAEYKNQYTLSLFGGYKNEILSAGVEYNRQFNKGFIEQKDFYGYSFFNTVKFAPKWSVYARYDLMESCAPSVFNQSWNSLNGQYSILGAEYQPIKQIKISPNLRNLNPDGRKSEQYIFLNAEFNL